MLLYDLFLVLTASFTLGVNRINHWNDHWTIFVETSISNTLSTVKFIWNFLYRLERNIILKQTNFGPRFLSLNCVKTSVGVPFCYKLSSKRNRRVRYLIIYDFHQVHPDSVKNVMLSQVKTFDRHYSMDLCLFISLNIILKIVFCGTCSIMMIQKE